MCLISTEINKVSDTKIFVSPSSDKKRQLTIYGNKVDNISNGNAMVLPVPLPETLQFHNLSNYKDFFEDCFKCFSQPMLKSLSYSLNSIKEAEGLEVFNVGSYLVSVAKNLDQLDKLNTKVFVLSPGLKSVLEMFYYQPYWGFIICKLAPGNNDYHPFAYSHDIISQKIYIPTRHFHTTPNFNSVNTWELGTRHGFETNRFMSNRWDESNIDKSPMFSSNISMKTTPDAYGWTNGKPNKGKFNDPVKEESNGYSEIADDWSHDIYFFNINPYGNKNLKNMNSSSSEWDNRTLPKLGLIDFPFSKCMSFEKIKITGTHPNIDLVF